MPRNAEVIRQWAILRAIERARGAGVTIDALAAQCDVTTRTIRRDLQALEEAGFPLFDDRSHDDGKTRWRVNGQAFRGLTAGLTVSELCALYFSRALVESLSATPFRDDVERAFEKLVVALTPHMRAFLDQLPRIIATKPDPLRRRPREPLEAAREQEIINRTLEATWHHRQATMTYHSASSGRTKSYRVHPYRLAYAQGGWYLLAYVPEYGGVRTFAIERLRDFSVREETFTPIDEVPDAAFPHSLGVHSGPPERIAVEFAPAVADYIRARQWHPSQQVRDAADGGVTLTLDVCVDKALESWILSFGPFARVVSPEGLAQTIARRFDEARARYGS